MRCRGMKWGSCRGKACSRRCGAEPRSCAPGATFCFRSGRFRLPRVGRSCALGASSELSLRTVSPAGDRRRVCSPTPSSGLHPGRKARCSRRAVMEQEFATRDSRCRCRREGAKSGSRCALASHEFETRAALSPAVGIDDRACSTRQARAVGPAAASGKSTRKYPTNSGWFWLRAVGPKPARSGLGTLDRKRPFWSPEAFLGKTKKVSGRGESRESACDGPPAGQRATWIPAFAGMTKLMGVAGSRLSPG